MTADAAIAETLPREARETPAASTPRPVRLASIELLRILACFGIVWFHHAGSRPLNFGNPGVSLFLMVSVAFMVLSFRAGGVPSLGKRLTRLATLWLAWSAFYAVFNLAKALISGRAPAEFFHPWMALTGPSIHLWFVSFLLGSTLFIGLVWRFLQPSPAWKPAITLLASATIPCCALLFDATSTYPFPQWAIGAPAVVFGALLGLQLDANAWPLRERLVWIAAMLGGGLCSLAFGLDGSVPFATLFGGLVLASAWDLPVPWAKQVRGLASLTLGIYLLHVAIGGVLGAYGPEMPALVHVTIVFVLCATLTAAAKRTPARQLI